MNRIKELRTRNNLTQKAFADSIFVSSSAVGQYESGKSQPSDRVLTRICEKYGVDRRWLLGMGSDVDTAANKEPDAGKTASNPPRKMAGKKVETRGAPEH